MDQLQLYVRIRGIVLGPFDMERLRAMAGRGQLSRVHEVSPDRSAWVRASNYPEIFANALPVREHPAPGEAQPQIAAQPATVGAPQHSVEPAGIESAESIAPTPNQSVVEPPQLPAVWFYEKDGREQGPVTASVLRRMLATGDLTPESFVWRHGTPAWIPLRETNLLPGKSDAFLADAHPNLLGAPAKDELPDAVCRPAIDSRPWVLFLSITGYLLAGLHVFMGIFVMIYGAKEHTPPMVANGLFMLLTAVVLGIGSALLMSYAGHLGRLQYSPVTAVFQRAIEALRTFWIFFSIVVAIILALLTVLIILDLATDTEIPSFYNYFQHV